VAARRRRAAKKKESGFAWAANFELTPTESSALRELAETAVSAYRTRTGKGLHRSIDSGSDTPKAVWAAPVCVLIVNTTEHVAYCNPAAAECFGLSSKDGYKSLIDTSPSPLPASLPEGKKYDSGYEKKVQQLPSAAAPQASATGEGEQEAATVTKVTIRDAERWALDKVAIVEGKLASTALGTAYAWGQWEEEDGTTCKPGGERIAPSIDPAEVQAALDAQASKIRAMKNEQGLTNADLEVQAAVAELQRLKALLPADE